MLIEEIWEIADKLMKNLGKLWGKFLNQLGGKILRKKLWAIWGNNWATQETFSIHFRQTS